MSKYICSPFHISLTIKLPTNRELLKEMLFLLFAVISVIPFVISVPHINNLDSDLTILIDNGIQGN